MQFTRMCITSLCHLRLSSPYHQHEHAYTMPLMHTWSIHRMHVATHLHPAGPRHFLSEGITVGGTAGALDGSSRTRPSHTASWVQLRAHSSPWLSLAAVLCAYDTHGRAAYSTDARVGEMAGAPSSVALPLSVQPYTWLLVTTTSTTLSCWSVGMLFSSCTSYDRATAGEGTERVVEAFGAWWEGLYERSSTCRVG